ncbi:MAG: rane protein [Bradyrhizobium sp.]|nr:rane protein [Bradyrhizobium sp.]
MPPFAATLTILVYQPNVSMAKPVAVVCGSLPGAAIGIGLSLVRSRLRRTHIRVRRRIPAVCPHQ